MFTLVPIRPRRRGERRSLRTFPGASLRPGSLGFNPRPRRLSTPTDAFELHPDVRSYRYPRGESYFDLISRLEPCIQEMESYNEPLLIVSHQAILRCIFAYLTGVDREKAPGMETQIQVRAGVFFSLASLSVDHTFHHVTKSLTNPP